MDNSDPVRPESVIMTDAEIPKPGSPGDSRRKDEQEETTDEKPRSQELQEESDEQKARDGEYKGRKTGKKEDEAEGGGIRRPKIGRIPKAPTRT